MQVTIMLNLSGQIDPLFVGTGHIGTVHGYVRTHCGITTQGMLA